MKMEFKMAILQTKCDRLEDCNEQISSIVHFSCGLRTLYCGKVTIAPKNKSSSTNEIIDSINFPKECGIVLGISTFVSFGFCLFIFVVYYRKTPQDEMQLITN